MVYCQGEVTVMFGDNLKKYRIDNHYSQSDLATKLFVTRQCISKWEKGITQPDLETLARISDILNVSIDALVKDDDSLTKESKNDRTPIVLFVYNVLAALFCLLSFIVLWRFMPNTIPAHWTNGAIDRYGSRNEILINMVSVVVFLVVDIIVYFATKRMKDKRGTYIAHIVLMLFQIANLILIIALYAKHISEDSSYITAMTANLLICMSIAMHPKINKPNSLLGVRTFDTLQSSQVWNKTNLLACYLCVGTSLLIFLLTMILVLPRSYLFLLLYIVPVVTSLVYAKIIAKKMSNNEPTK